MAYRWPQVRGILSDLSDGLREGTRSLPMLSPDDRTLLVDLLTPPEGFTLHHAIATTFTLHLTALLPVPLGFAGLISILRLIRSVSSKRSARTPTASTSSAKPGWCRCRSNETICSRS